MICRIRAPRFRLAEIAPRKWGRSSPNLRWPGGTLRLEQPPRLAPSGLSSHQTERSLGSPSQGSEAPRIAMLRQRRCRSIILPEGAPLGCDVRATGSGKGVGLAPINSRHVRRRRLDSLAAANSDNNVRGDMPFGMPFGERPQRSSQLAVALLGHQHCQGRAPHSFATTEARTAPHSITWLQR